MKMVILGNLRAPHSTEGDWKHAFEEIGFDVATVQEDDWIQGRAAVPPPDSGDAFLLWVRTWPAPDYLVERDLGPWQNRAKPIVGAHLDRWFGLIGREDRQNLVYTDPYFAWLDWWFCADPCHQHWSGAGVNHVWMPPAVSTRNPLSADSNPKRWDYDIAFVGNTDPDSYHPEHTHRFAMLVKLRQRYGPRFAELPGPGRQRITGLDLTEIYRTVPVIIGDSALVGLDAYWSDRIPETVGRGGYLVHPDTDWQDQFTPGYHFDVWRLGDWDHMFSVIDYALANPEHRQWVSGMGRGRVLDWHTYTDRAREIAVRVLE